MNGSAVEDKMLLCVLEGAGLSVVFQPIVDLGLGSVVGYEALSRFSDGRSPEAWLAEAEGLGLRVDLELTALRVALGRIGEVPASAYVSFNVSADVVTTDAFAHTLEGAPMERLVIEINGLESSNCAAVQATIHQMRAGGARVAIDDVGAGSASLSYILQLSPDVIKLELALSRGIDADQSKRALIGALVACASGINCTVVAEGIETVEELDALAGLGVGHGQGFFLGRPSEDPKREGAAIAPHRVRAADDVGGGMDALLLALVQTAHSNAVYEAPRHHRFRRFVTAGLSSKRSARMLAHV
jgi:EAL domain-containing protein (putative c-di-GMP-specific phosphodiesterase class I)